uniref:Basic helix-loop-helix ARNT like 1 n=1 Tax=Loxodonta africana TaxID=9785 RepID=G3TVX8_LOXAF
MADQRMDISSTISDFMSPGPPDLLSSSLSTSGLDCNRKRKGSSTDYQGDSFWFIESMDTDKDDPHGRLEYTEHQGRIKNAREAHSQIEKRRRDKMNSFIDELASLVPTCNAMSRKLDKLTVLRMAVQHMKTLRGATNPYTEANYKPTFLSDDELKHLILRAADGFLFVVGCDRGKILFVSESVFKILNYSQNDLIGQSLFDYLHPKDIAKVKEQLSSSDTAPRERLIDAKTGLPVKTDITPGPSRLCSGARRSFFCRMKCNRPSVKVEDKDFPSTCSKKKDEAGSLLRVLVQRFLAGWSGRSQDCSQDPSDPPYSLGQLGSRGESREALKSVPGFIQCKIAINHLNDFFFFKFPFRATAILAYLPQELLGTSCYEYFHQDDIGHLAECHRQVLQTREKITTNCYKFKIKDGSFITLRSRWFSFMNPWTKEVEYIVSTNTVVLCLGLLTRGRGYRQQPVSHSLMLPCGPKRTHPTVPGIPGGTRAGAGKIGRMIAEEIMEIHRIRGSSPSSCGSSPLNITSTPPPDASSPGGKKILNGGTPDISSSGLLPGQAQENPGYPYSDSSSILGENPHIGIDMIDNDQGSSSPSNDEAAMAVIMSLLEADAGLGGPVDFSDLPWPL